MYLKKQFISNVLKVTYADTKSQISNIILKAYIENKSMPFQDEGINYGEEYSYETPTLLAHPNRVTFRKNLEPYKDVLREMIVVESFLIRWANANKEDLRSLEMGIPIALHTTNVKKYIPSLESKLIAKRLMLNSLGHLK